jgi:hypothetical protein
LLPFISKSMFASAIRNLKIRNTGHKTRNFTVALYGCETCSLVLTVEYRPLKSAMSEKITFGPKKQEVTAEKTE